MVTNTQVGDSVYTNSQCYYLGVSQSNILKFLLFEDNKDICELLAWTLTFGLRAFDTSDDVTPLFRPSRDWSLQTCSLNVQQLLHQTPELGRCSVRSISPTNNVGLSSPHQPFMHQPMVKIMQNNSFSHLCFCKCFGKKLNKR